MNITLILAADPDDPLVGSDPMMPLSLPLLAGAAPAHTYTFVDLLKRERIPDNPNCDLAGISYRANSERKAFEIADRFRLDGIPVVLGGPQASANPQGAIEHADAVAIGEAENLWPKIIRDIDNQCASDFYVSSICRFENDEYTVHREDSTDNPLLNINPQRGYFKKKYVFDTVFAMRGCNVGCDFCFVPKMYGLHHRQRPAEDVVREIADFKRYYYLLDDTVFGRKTTYDYYLELYDRIGQLPKQRYWTGQANLDAASNEKGRQVIKMAARSGMLYAAIGMESINPEVLRKNGADKKMGFGSGTDPLEKMIENIHFIQDQGIIISGWFTIGYEEDTVETIFETYEFCRKHRIIPVIFLVKPLMGTPLYKRLQKEGTLDSVLRTGVLTSNFTADEAMAAFEKIYQDTYRFSENIRRIRFHISRWRENPIKDRIHKSFFLWFLQKNLNSAMKKFPRYYNENRLTDV